MKNEGRFEIQWLYEYYLLRCDILEVVNILNPEPFQIAFNFFWKEYAVELTNRLDLEFKVNKLIGKDNSVINFY